MQQWMDNFAKPLEVLNQLQYILEKNVPVDAFIDAVLETVNTRGTCKRKLDGWRNNPMHSKGPYRNGTGFLLNK